jgi:ElaB/YqjD/DUF883 family membrane-anchored ribosome-binding protein
MAEKIDLNPSTLQQAMAEKRLSLSASLYDLEQEAGQRVRQSMDHIQRKIAMTSDEISRTVTKPIHKVQEALEKGSETLRSKPMQSALIIASAGIALGYVVGRRRQSRRAKTMALAAPVMLPPDSQYVTANQMRKTASRGFLAHLALEALHQIALSSVVQLMRRRS